MKKIIQGFALIFCCLALSIVLQSCEQEGPAEKAGEKVDSVMEQTKEKMEEAGDKMQETVEEGGEELEKMGEKMQE